MNPNRKDEPYCWADMRNIGGCGALRPQWWDNLLRKWMEKGQRCMRGFLHVDRTAMVIPICAGYLKKTCGKGDMCGMLHTDQVRVTHARIART